MGIFPLSNPGSPWRIAGIPASEDPDTRFRLAEAPPNVRRWILNLYRGIQAYFPIPDEASWAELQAVAQWKSIDSKRRSYERIWEPRIEAVLSWHGPLVAQAYGRTRSEEAAMKAISGEMIPALQGELGLLQLDVERGFLASLASSVRIGKVADPFTIVDPLLIPALLRWNKETLGQKITRIDEVTRRRINNAIVAGTRAGDSIATIMDRIRLDQAFSRFRSYLIARTEVIASSNAATHFGIQANLPPQKVTKEWLSTLDGRTRATHVVAGMTQKKIPQKEPFRCGGFNLMFPGDSSLGAPGHEVIQCRCTALYNYYPPNRRTPRVPVPPPPVPPKPIPAPKPAPISAEQALEDRIRRTLEKMMAVKNAQSQLLIDLAERAVRLQNRAYQATTAAERAIIMNQYNEAMAVVQSLSKKARSEVHTILFEMAPKKKLKLALKKVSKELRERAKEAKIFLESIAGDRWEAGFKIIYKKIEGRAYASAIKREVALDVTDPTSIHVHEIGHILEGSSKNLLQEAEDFLIRRTAGESPVRLKELFPNLAFEPDEIALKDKFESPYTGKIYRNRYGSTALGTYATEITSMGLQQLHENPLKMFLIDQDYFEWILRFLWGSKP